MMKTTLKLFIGAWVGAIAIAVIGAASYGYASGLDGSRRERLLEKPNHFEGADNKSKTKMDNASLEIEKSDLIAQESMASSTKIIAWLTGGQLVLVVMTTVGLAVTIHMNRVSVKQTREVISDNRRYSEIQLRAYIGYGEIEVHDYIKDEIASVKLCVKNFGSTPAVNVQLWSARSSSDGFPMSKEFDFPEKIEFRTIPDIAPGASSETRFFVSPKLSDATIADHTARKKSFGIFMVIIYDDIFGQRHMFRYSAHRSGRSLYRSRRNAAFIDQSHPDFLSRMQMRGQTVEIEGA